MGFYANGKFNKISVEGGAVVPLADVSGTLGASWGEDGNIVSGTGPSAAWHGFLPAEERPRR